MALALLANTSPRIIAILNAAPESVWASTVSGNVGAFPSQAEITAAQLEADGDLITRGYFNSINNSLAQRFMSFSAPLAKGEKIPEHRGNTGAVEISRLRRSFASLSVNAGTDTITITGHGFRQGEPVSLIGTSLPTGLSATATYYVIRESANAIKLAANITNAALGTAVDITVAGSGQIIAWDGGIEADSVDDVRNAVDLANDYVEAGALSYIWKMHQGRLYHAADFARIEIPMYSRTSVLQGNIEDEPIIIGLAIKLLTKDASPAPFEKWARIADEGMDAIIRDGSYQERGQQQDQNP